MKTSHSIALIFILAVTSHLEIFSQHIYYDSQWKEIPSEVDASFYRVIDTLSDNSYHVKDFYIEGQIQMDGNYSSLNKERKNGAFTYFQENGKKTTFCIYKEGQLHGHYKTWHKNGKQKAIGRYELGKSDSTWTWFDTSGVKLSNGQFKNGRKHGQFTTYYSNGYERETFNILNDQLDGSLVHFDSTGIIVVEVIINAKKRNASFTRYYQNGNVQGKGTINKGKLDGDFSVFYPSGGMRATGQVDNGYTFGKWIYYYENGVMEQIVEFNKDTREKIPVDNNILRLFRKI